MEWTAVDDLAVNNSSKSELLDAVNTAIPVLLKRKESIAQALGKCLYIIDKKELWKIDTEAKYKGVGDMAERIWDIKPSTTSEAIKVFARFGTVYGIADKSKANKDKDYPVPSEFAYSKLIVMAKYDDDVLFSFLGITPKMTRASIITRLKEYEEYKKEMKEWPAGPDKDRIEQAGNLETAKSIKLDIVNEQRKKEGKNPLDAEGNEIKPAPALVTPDTPTTPDTPATPATSDTTDNTATVPDTKDTNKNLKDEFKQAVEENHNENKRTYTEPEIVGPDDNGNMVVNIQMNCDMSKLNQIVSEFKNEGSGEYITIHVIRK